MEKPLEDRHSLALYSQNLAQILFDTSDSIGLLTELNWLGEILGFPAGRYRNGGRGLSGPEESLRTPPLPIPVDELTIY